MLLNESRFVGTLSSDLTELTDATLSAVWKKGDALANLDLFAEQKGYCPGTMQYILVNSLVGTASDLRLDLKPAVDKDCDAISIGMLFSASKAKLGTVGAPETILPSQCDGGTDAAGD
jgi:hypothetical protein